MRGISGLAAVAAVVVIAVVTVAAIAADARADTPPAPPAPAPAPTAGAQPPPTAGAQPPPATSPGTATAALPAAAPRPAPAPTGVTPPPPELVRENLLVLAHAKTARDAASAGHCEVVRQISVQVQALDPVFHQTLFALDPGVAACLGLPVPAGSLAVRARPRQILVVDRRDPPASFSRIAGELAIGAFVGGGGALIGALIGGGLCIDGGEERDCDNSLIGGMYVGAVATIPIGVYVVGNASGETGSLAWTYVGAAAGGLGGLLMLANGREDITILGMLLAPPLGAIIGFNSTRRYKPRRMLQGALLHLDDGRLSLGVPLVTRAISHERAVTTIPLLGGRF